MTLAKYILACDERGTTRWPSPTKSWTFGGFVVESRKRSTLTSVWSTIKLELCGSENCELKWSHFFSGSHQRRLSNPLLSTAPQVWREQAKWALEKLFQAVSVIPIVMYVRKDIASEHAFEITEDGRQVLNIDVIWVGILGQFATFLKQHNAHGEIWFDQLGSRKEETRKQASWKYLRDAEWPIQSEHRATLQRIAPTLQFFDSKVEPVVQIADFISGVAWAASEGDEEFLLEFLDKFGRAGGRTFRILNIV
jgi:hypothetical protein